MRLVTRRLVLLIAGTASLAVLAAGCGGDDNGGGGDRLTNAAFVAQANAICKKANDKAEALQPDLPQNFDPKTATDEQLDTFGDFLDDVVGIFRPEIDELRDLNPPENVEDDFNQALSLVEESLNEADEAAEAAHDGDGDKVQEKLDESEEHSDEADEIATKLGLTVCAG
jgi:hypothetical protein